jgi:predicted restriction endonuclease
LWVYEGDNHTIGIGRQHRQVPRWLRRRLRKRDGARCRFPGCERTLGLHAHHMQHWADHGCTDTPNLVMLCPFHHHLMHEGGWSVTGDADVEVTFHSRDGTRHLRSRPTPMTRDTRERIEELAFLQVSVSRSDGRVTTSGNDDA